jgi:hypothetical protein
MSKTTSFSNEFLMSNYDTDLGRLEVNLRSLEVNIRIFLLIHEKGYEKAVQFNKSLRKLKIEKEVENNPFTNFASFSKLVDDYNDIVSSSHIYHGLKIDCKIKSLRNTLAHGRAFYLEQSPPYKTMLLLQFSKPENDKTTLEFNKKMTAGWLNKNIIWTQKQDKKVVEASNRLKVIKP